MFDLLERGLLRQRPRLKKAFRPKSLFSSDRFYLLDREFSLRDSVDPIARLTRYDSRIQPVSRASYASRDMARLRGLKSPLPGFFVLKPHPMARLIGNPLASLMIGSVGPAGPGWRMPAKKFINPRRVSLPMEQQDFLKFAMQENLYKLHYEQDMSDDEAVCLKRAIRKEIVHALGIVHRVKNRGTPSKGRVDCSRFNFRGLGGFK